VVEQVKGKLENADLIFSVAAGKITVKQISALRKAIPETSKAAVVKNTLMTRWAGLRHRVMRALSFWEEWQTLQRAFVLSPCPPVIAAH
jgi:hypothetical protein